jgi:hypothetical protein
MWMDFKPKLGDLFDFSKILKAVAFGLNSFVVKLTSGEPILALRSTISEKYAKRYLAKAKHENGNQTFVTPIC